ncbi:MAG: hypothetical protein LBF72_00740 [Holosporales bacterium]|jgi:ABC-type multidrug transport system fused ATPase/permease subunit|nr:hypothetical protein [Holosporales bacterium]
MNMFSLKVISSVFCLVLSVIASSLSVELFWFASVPFALLALFTSLFEFQSISIAVMFILLITSALLVFFPHRNSTITDQYLEVPKVLDFCKQKIMLCLLVCAFSVLVTISGGADFAQATVGNRIAEKLEKRSSNSNKKLATMMSGKEASSSFAKSEKSASRFADEKALVPQSSYFFLMILSIIVLLVAIGCVSILR